MPQGGLRRGISFHLPASILSGGRARCSGSRRTRTTAGAGGDASRPALATLALTRDSIRDVSSRLRQGIATTMLRYAASWAPTNPRRRSKAMKEHREIWIGFVEAHEAISCNQSRQAASRERVPRRAPEIPRRFSCLPRGSTARIACRGMVALLWGAAEQPPPHYDRGITTQRFACWMPPIGERQP